MSEKIDKKVKGFRISPDLINVVDRLIKDSGKDPGEWFEDLVQQVSTNELVLEKNEIPVDLRKHFGSDIAAIKDANNLITTLFINQMNRIAVEKNNWNQLLHNTQKEYEDKLNKLKDDTVSLKNEVESKDMEIKDVHNHLLQLQNKIDGFDKLETQLKKNIERLENDKEKNEQELLRLREETLFEKEKTQADMDELKGAHKEEKDRLNQQIVDLVEELKKVDPLNQENAVLQEKIKELNSSLKNEIAQYNINLTRIKEQAELEKEKALLMRERELREELHNQNREDTKDLYDKLEKLQLENGQLRLEMNNLKQNE